MHRTLSFAIAVMLGFAASAETVFLETEAFDDWGGWVNDTQFMDQMGSPYLLAHGLGKPVADAKTTVKITEAAEYRVWVRTKNWTAGVYAEQGLPVPEEPAGTFELLVNGTPLKTELGAQGKGEWTWVEAGRCVLAGQVTLALHDRDGFDGRCDAIVLTTDAAPDFGALRKRSLPHNGVAGQSYDLVVVGGGVAGICTAVSAARLGLKVALVHDRPILGGNNSSEVRVHLGAWQNMPPYPRLGDVLAEFGPKRGGNAESAANYEDDRKLAIVKAEKNIDLFLNQRVNAVKTGENGRIVSVTAQDTRSGCRNVYSAACFADCTGDGNVGFLAGADFRQGREGKDETHEPSAPEKADTLTMGASVQWYAGKKKVEKAGGGGEGCLFPVRPWMLKSFTDENCSPHMKGDWWWEAGLGRDQIKEAEYIRDYGLLVAFSNWAFVKNCYSNKAEFADIELKWVAYNGGRRESRRLLGDFILDQNHLRNKDFQKDGTCVTTWTIDLHEPKTEEETKFKGESYQSNSLNEKIWPYPIPYRCLYSRNVPNLFMAGRDISVTHIALGTTRLMRTHGMMGEVVGMAAAVCKRNGCDPRGVYTDHLDELKALMEKGVGDGKAHPSQMYNIQDSLDPRFHDYRAGNFQIK